MIVVIWKIHPPNNFLSILHFCWKGQKTITRYLFCAFLWYIHNMSKRTVRRPDFTKGLHLTPKNSFWRLWLLFFLQKPFPFYHQMSDTWHICAKKGQKHFFPLKNSTLACACSSLVNHLQTPFRTVLFKVKVFSLHFDIWLKPKEVGTPYCFCRVFFQKLSLHCSSINLNGYSLFFSVS